MSQNILQYESDVWKTPDLFIGAGVGEILNGENKSELLKRETPLFGRRRTKDAILSAVLKYKCR